MKRSNQPFLEKLNAATAKKDCGLYLYDRFLPPHEARDAFDVLVDDAKFPWDTKPVLFGETLTQHAYKHDREKYSRNLKKSKSKSKSKTNISWEGISKLEAICSKIEHDFGVKVSYVFCNRFEDPSHRIDWHKDTYGEHICVLSLGSKRRIEFRNNHTQEIDSVTPDAGDLYVMPLHINKTHKHRVCSAIQTDPAEARGNNHHSSTRLSFVFFFEAPSYATKEFRISRKDRLMGYLEEMREIAGI